MIWDWAQMHRGISLENPLAALPLAQVEFQESFPGL